MEKHSDHIVNGDYNLRLGACYMKLRVFGEKCYCELPGLYVGEIDKPRLIALYYGLTGKELFTCPA